MNWGSVRLGGKARAHVIVLLAMTLGLGGADLGAVGSMSAILQQQFSINQSQIGTLIAASQGAGIFSTLYFGWAVDRSNRTRILAIAVMLWAVAMMLCGAATSFLFLLITRVVLGAVAAATLPCTASLIGDYFPQNERAKIYGYILSGEMIGTGVGFILSGETALLWWRLGFWVLLLPAVPLAWWIHKLPEPERGGASRLAPGQEEIASRKRQQSQPDQSGANGERLIAKKIREKHVSPRARLVREDDPSKKSLWWAIKYVLSIPTNVLLIIGSALGFAFFVDMRTFGLEYAQQWFHVGHSAAVWLLLLLGVGAIAGIWTGGRLADRLLAKGHLLARVWVGAAFFWISIGFFLLAFLFHLLWLSMIFFVCSGFFLGGVNPPIDSARLDIMHPQLWGRAESVRTILRNACEALAPVSFGWLVAALGGGAGGLRAGLMLMLIPLAIAGIVSFFTFRTYPADAAAADAYAKKTSEKSESPENQKQ